MQSRELRKAHACAVALPYPAIDASLAARLIALVLLAALIGGFAANRTWASAQIASAAQSVQAQTASMGGPLMGAMRRPAPVEAAPGVDVDGDGESDFMNPTGLQAREHDAYGAGYFGASRDGGGRMHEGVDYISRVGQDVAAPMSGYVTRVGWAYSGDQSLRTVEITNPALKYVARILYVDPAVRVGQAVHMGEVIGAAQSLQDKYPGGMTNHVHLQIARKGRPWMDATLLIPETRG